MGKYLSRSFLKLVKAYENGRVKDEHFDILIEQPDKVAQLGKSPFRRAVERMIAPLNHMADGSFLFIHDGKPCYNAEGRNEKQLVVWGDWKSEEYTETGIPSLHDGKLFYSASRNDKRFLVWGDWKSEEYDDIFYGSISDGKPLYIGVRDKKRVLVWGDWKSEEYTDIYLFEEGELHAVYNGTLLYSAELFDGKWRIMLGDQILEEVSGDYSRVDAVRMHEGKLLYRVERGGKEFIIWGDRSIGEAEGIYYLSVYDGKLFYSVTNHQDVEFIVWGDWKSEVYTEIGIPSIHDGKPLYVARRCDDKWFVVWGDWKSEEYEEVYDAPSFYDGKPLYVAENYETDQHWIMLGDEILQEMHDHRCCSDEDLSIHDGKPLYVGRREDKVFVVWGEDESKVYDRIVDLSPTENGIAFYAMKGKTLYRVEVSNRR